LASTSLADIKKRIASLQREADALRAREKASVVERIKQAIALYAISAEDLGFGRPARAKPGPKPKAARPGGKSAGRSGFSDGAGNHWSGRGPRPGWFKAALAAGRSVDDLRA
jgi:DNA-binding protein H-NS